MSAISILMIERDQTIAGRLSNILRNVLYDVETASGGTLAMTMFAARHYDLLIMNNCATS